MGILTFKSDEYEEFWIRESRDRRSFSCKPLHRRRRIYKRVSALDSLPWLIRPRRNCWYLPERQGAYRRRMRAYRASSRRPSTVAMAAYANESRCGRTILPTARSLLLPKYEF